MCLLKFKYIVNTLKEQYLVLGYVTRMHYSFPWVLIWIPDTEDYPFSHGAAFSLTCFSLWAKDALDWKLGVATSLQNTGTLSPLGMIFRKLSGVMSLLFLISLLAQTETAAG